MAKRAFFVIGSEGSGTNMLAEALVSAGCHYEPKHNSHLDDYEFEFMPDLLVFRRSIPHAGQMPDLWRLKTDLTIAGFRVHCLFILRDWFCTVQSVIRRDPERHPRMIELNMNIAMKEVARVFPDALYVSYESFCLHPEFRQWLFRSKFALPAPTIEINYANPKYYMKWHTDWPDYKGG